MQLRSHTSSSLRSTLIGRHCWVLALACLPLYACGGREQNAENEAVLAEQDIVDGDHSGDEARATVQVLNAFSVGDHQFSFQAWRQDDNAEGSGAVMIVDDYATTDYLSVLTNEYPSLTSLEILLALAPEGTEPHPTVVAAHESEARGLGRSGDAISVNVVDGRNPTVEKDYSADCDASLLFGDEVVAPLYFFTHEARPIALDGAFFYLCAGFPAKFGQGSPTGCQNFPASNLLRVAACTDDFSVNPATVIFYQGTFAGLPMSLPPGRTLQSTMLPVFPPPNPAPARSMAVKYRNSIAHDDNSGIIMSGVAIP